MKIRYQRRLTCDELSHFRIRRLPQESEQRWNTSGVPHSNLVIVHRFAIDEVSQGATRVPLHLDGLMVQQVHQVFDSSQPTHLRKTNEMVKPKSLQSEHFHHQYLFLLRRFKKNTL